MLEARTRVVVLACALTVIAALLFVVAPALAASGDYGVATGASAASSQCGGRGEPPCSITHGGYTATFRTISNGYAVYSFTFSCELLLGTDLSRTVVGSECSQYLNTSSGR